MGEEFTISELAKVLDEVSNSAKENETNKCVSCPIKDAPELLEKAFVPNHPRPQPSPTTSPASANHSAKEDETLLCVSVRTPLDEADDEVDAAGPIPLVRGQRAVTARPGAIAISGMGGHGSDAHLVRGQITSQESSGISWDFSSTCSLAQTEEHETHGLIVANPVYDEEAVVATMHSVSTQRRKQPDSARAPCHVLLFAAIFLAIVLVFPAAVISRKKQHNQTPPNQPSGTHYGNPATQAPTSFTASLLSLFPESTVQSILENANSPQSKAFQWILEDDINLSFYSYQRIIQKFTLATLYYATSGDGWTQRGSWLNHSVHECEWFQQPSLALKHVWESFLPGYLKDFSDEQDGPICDSNGIFLHLWLDQNNLKGSFPLELFMLTSLQSMTVTLNELKGTIPTELGLLTNLEALVFTYLTSPGTIPTEIGLLTNLRALALDNNMLTGTVPSQIWQLTNLGSLFLFQNPHLVGTLPTDIGTLSNLYWVSWHTTGLTGAGNQGTVAVLFLVYKNLTLSISHPR
jgi:hypothetical protein